MILLIKEIGLKENKRYSTWIDSQGIAPIWMIWATATISL